MLATRWCVRGVFAIGSLGADNSLWRTCSQGCRAREIENLLLKQTPPKRIVLVRLARMRGGATPHRAHLTCHTTAAPQQN